ncbi:DUF4105 domain-containing protein [Castellaniella sp. GW247-6E4]|uniref:Lnb N-terminal periplasmic domain-containing protein n=1 Tax=Castellaniella sp. GW247-6E4 TaxID=3140380 RepID=UPI003315B627
MSATTWEFLRAMLSAPAGKLILSLMLLSSGAWGTLALFYQSPFQPGRPAVWLLCSAWAALALAAAALVWTQYRFQALAAYVLVFVALCAWWSMLAPSDARDWAPDVSRHLHAEVDGSIVTLHNVRNFDWHSDTDFVERWETRRYDLDSLSSVDVIASYWMGPAIAHTLVSFGFNGGRDSTDYLVFSIEIRKERGEAFSAVGGFFKQFELSLVAADERDVLRVRADTRKEDVYLYRVNMSKEAARSLFLAYLAKAQALVAEPRYYHTLTANCTTIVYEMARRIVPGLPMNWRLLASGYLPEYLEQIGGLAGPGDLEVLRAAGRITLRAQQADSDAAFSRIIRQGVPGMETGLAP